MMTIMFHVDWRGLGQYQREGREDQLEHLEIASFTNKMMIIMMTLMFHVDWRGLCQYQREGREGQLHKRVFAFS